MAAATCAATTICAAGLAFRWKSKDRRGLQTQGQQREKKSRWQDASDRVSAALASLCGSALPVVAFHHRKFSRLLLPAGLPSLRPPSAVSPQRSPVQRSAEAGSKVASKLLSDPAAGGADPASRSRNAAEQSVFWVSAGCRRLTGVKPPELVEQHIVEFIDDLTSWRRAISLTAISLERIVDRGGGQGISKAGAPWLASSRDLREALQKLREVLSHLDDASWIAERDALLGALSRRADNLRRRIELASDLVAWSVEADAVRQVEGLAACACVELWEDREGPCTTRRRHG